MRLLLTGVAGFIGMHCAKALLEQGHHVVGVDNCNDYYNPQLKRDRLALLAAYPHFTFHLGDIADKSALHSIVSRHPDITHVLHLAAQAGVRYSLENPDAYVQSNLVGHVNILELCRSLGAQLKHCVFASSSSVYGEGAQVPFSESALIQTPRSLYAATKIADEALSYSYASLYGIPSTGLRFFTVYGPWGRPDMAPFLFTDALLRDRPITLYNQGQMRRDFTYIDDIVAGTLAALHQPPHASDAVPYAIYNLGNNQTVSLHEFVQTIESITGKKAAIGYAPMQAGDMVETCADITHAQQAIAYRPVTSLAQGMEASVAWFRAYYGL